MIVNMITIRWSIRIIVPKYVSFVLNMGEFWQLPSSHKRGIGCPKCSGCYVPTTEEWIASARKVHGDKYDYSKVDYVNKRTKVCIICPEHGEFWAKPA